MRKQTRANVIILQASVQFWCNIQIIRLKKGTEADHLRSKTQKG